jgi:hypothetical protein
MGQRLEPDVRQVIVLFPLAWALHDLEEVLMMSAWSGRAAERIRGRFPWIPRHVAQAVDTTPAQATVAVGVIGGIVTWSSLRALQSQSVDTGLFLPALAAYTGHAFIHLADGVDAAVHPRCAGPGQARRKRSRLVRWPEPRRAPGRLGFRDLRALSRVQIRAWRS